MINRYKIITVHEGLLLLDLEAEIKVNDCVYTNQLKEVFICVNEFDLSRKDNPKGNVFRFEVYKIIASTYIKELPLLSQSIDEIRQMIKDKEIEDISNQLYLMEEDNFTMNMITSEKRRAFSEGYKSNKAVYTEEQMIEAITKAMFLFHEDNVVSIIQTVLQSLQPKIDCNVEVEKRIGEYDNIPDTTNYYITKIL